MEPKTPTFTALYEDLALDCKVELLVIKYTNKIVFFITELNKLGAVIRCDSETDSKEFIPIEPVPEAETIVGTRVLLGNRGDETLTTCANAITRILHEHYRNVGKPTRTGTISFLSLKKRSSQDKVVQFIIGKIREDIHKIA